MFAENSDVKSISAAWDAASLIGLETRKKKKEKRVKSRGGNTTTNVPEEDDVFDVTAQRKEIVEVGVGAGQRETEDEHAKLKVLRRQLPHGERSIALAGSGLSCPRCTVP